jgi:enamine deaminase RidA (YjgF/YER057c/UK114 family)
MRRAVGGFATSFLPRVRGNTTSHRFRKECIDERITSVADSRAAVVELGLAQPPPFPPAGNYVSAVRTGDLIVLAGHIPIDAENSVVLGKLGDELDVEDGRKAARLAALSALSTLRAELGSLDRVVRLVSVRGWVNSTPDFIGHTQVIDSASDVFTDVFGEAGRHARLGVGLCSLPANLALEIELTAEVSA